MEDVDLAFLRSREDIKHDKKAFLNDSEWELLSVSSTYDTLQSSAGEFAQIQFHVGPPCPPPTSPPTAHLSALWSAPRPAPLAQGSALRCALAHFHPGTAGRGRWPSLLSAFQRRERGRPQILDSCCGSSTREYKENGFQTPETWPTHHSSTPQAFQHILTPALPTATEREKANPHTPPPNWERVSLQRQHPVFN